MSFNSQLLELNVAIVVIGIQGNKRLIKPIIVSYLKSNHLADNIEARITFKRSWTKRLSLFNANKYPLTEKHIQIIF